MNSYDNYITKLESNEVFVFGSNKHGFHGAGSAGFASFNKSGNVWRDEDYGSKPLGWKGCWNVKGVAEGFQKGTIGRSYAIPTVIKPGMLKSISIEDISLSIKSLYAFALSQPQLMFLVAQDAKVGYNGHSPEDMAKAFLVVKPPLNIYFYKPFAEIIEKIS